MLTIIPKIDPSKYINRDIVDRCTIDILANNIDTLTDRHETLSKKVTHINYRINNIIAKHKRIAKKDQLNKIE